MNYKLTLLQIRKFFLVLSFALVMALAGYWAGTHQLALNFEKGKGFKIERAVPADKESLDFSLFWTVWDRLSAAYLDKAALSPTEMVYGAIRGMVASLKDPYTAFLPPKENRLFKEDLNGSPFEGVGIQLGFIKERLGVIAPLKRMPAYRAGVKAGDLILKIDDKDTTDITLPEAVNLIRGPKGTKVKLTLYREGDKDNFVVELVREEIIVPTVEMDLLSRPCGVSPCQYAFLKLLRFGDRTNSEWEAAVSQIVATKPGVAGIILDLRNNPGGYLMGSVFIASEFLESGVVVQQQGASKTETFSVNRKGRLLKHPLVVLVNKGTASASEILAGALQEKGRGKVVGEKTFGKGTVQEAEDLPGGAGLHITTARWLLPSGKSIDKVGVKPDNEIADDPKTADIDEQLEKAIEILLK